MTAPSISSQKDGLASQINLHLTHSALIVGEVSLFYALISDGVLSQELQSSTNTGVL